MIEGVSPDAEIVTNKDGGKQSKSEYAFHLIDPLFLFMLTNQDEYDCFIDCITDFMHKGDSESLFNAIKELSNTQKALFTIAKVLKYGADRYEANNWRLIPQEDHLNHALIHYFAYKAGDTQDDHLGHCLCRLMMVYATECSKNFNYTKYIKS